MNIVLLGPPGAGKGTQATRLAGKLNLTHLATGDMLRSEVANGTELGRLAKTYMDRGDLVPDDVIVGMISARLGSGGLLLDGFPRTVVQAEALDAALEEAGHRLDRAIYLAVDRDELIERLSGRAVCSKCQQPYNLKSAPPSKDRVCDKCGGDVVVRDDDKPEAIRNRMAVYQKQTTPVLDYYRSSGRLTEENGMGSPDQVQDRLLAAAGA
jgi:adenylate kinase